METKRAHSNRKNPNPNTTLPELDSKDSKEEQKTSHHSFAHYMDVDWHLEVPEDQQGPGFSGYFPTFPIPHKPTTNDHVQSFLEKVQEISRPNLVIAHSKATDTAVCLL